MLRLGDAWYPRTAILCAVAKGCTDDAQLAIVPVHMLG
jgi:hypothetical protein